MTAPAFAVTPEFRVSWTPEHLIVEFQGPAEHAVFAAVDSTGDHTGSAVVPFAAGGEGSTLFLAMKAQRIYAARPAAGGRWERFARAWRGTMWSDRAAPPESDLGAAREGGTTRLRIARSALGKSAAIGVTAWAKDLRENGGWGSLSASTDPAARTGQGDVYVPHYLAINLASADAPKPTGRLSAGRGERVRIYQCLPRVFGNANETRKPNGTIKENGVGKFSAFTEKSLGEIKAMGFTHLWLTGVLQQATATDYADIGAPADDADLLKGLAGSPYAIKDYFDVCPDYADEPAKRLDEFQACVRRARAAGLRVIIDFVPNHVARSYASDVKPEHDFGARGQGGKGDDRAKFFDPQNNFYYLQPGHPGGGPPLRLPTWDPARKVALSPTCQVPGVLCDGFFKGEMDHGKVTGNNAVTWAPDINTWYETVKLNYGFDFTNARDGRHEFPRGAQPGAPVPDTWKKMDAVLAHWQTLGVDGFRCDMAHMIPPEFWHWAIARARTRQPEVFFAAEAYDNDPAKVPGGDPLLEALAGGRGNVMFNLLNAGFDAVYDDPSYKVLKRIYEQGAWANDLDRELGEPFIAENSLRYAENHDEVRLASPREWAAVGMDVGRPVSAILWGMTRGPAMLYSGQEVGEPAAGAEGFGGDDARTTIFDYWSMPEFNKWTNGGAFDGGKLSDQQRSLRAFYARLARLAGEPAFRDGNLFLLNGANNQSRAFGRLPGEGASGHWMSAFLRHDRASGQKFLVVANLHRSETFRDVQVRLPAAALDFLAVPRDATKRPLIFRDRLAETDSLAAKATPAELPESGLKLPAVPPLSALYLEITGE